MIKIIKPGPLRRVTCPSCGALLSYDEREDVQTETWEDYHIDIFQWHQRYTNYILCPQCDEQIVLNPIEK